MLFLFMKNLFTLKKYFAKYKKKLAWGFLFILISNIGMVYVPVLLKDAINSIQKHSDIKVLFNYGILIVLTSLVSGIFRFLIRQTIIVVSREIEYDLRQDFWGHIQRLSLRYFQNNSTGNIMAHATNDMNAVRMFIGPAVMYSIDTGIRLVIVIGIMMALNPELTFYALLPLPLLSVLVYRVGKLIHEKFTLIQEKFSEITTRAQENFSGIRVIKSYIREENEIKEFNRLSKEYLHLNMKMITRTGFDPAASVSYYRFIHHTCYLAGGNKNNQCADDTWRCNCFYNLPWNFNMANDCLRMGNKYYPAGGSKHEKIK